MEVITIESKAYSNIIKRLDAKNNEIATIESKAYSDVLKRLEAYSNNFITIESRAYNEIMKQLSRISKYMLEHEADEDWVDDKIVSDYLKISVRTLQRLRTSNSINYTFVGRKPMYKIGEIRRLLSQNIIRCNPQNFQDLLNNYEKDAK